MYVTANWRKSSILSVSVKSDLNVNSLRSRLTYLPCGHAWAPVPTVSFLDAHWQYSHADFTLVSFKASCLLHKWAEEACVWAQSVYFLVFFFSSPDLFPADRWPKPPCTSAPQWMCVCVWPWGYEWVSFYDSVWAVIARPLDLQCKTELSLSHADHCLR